MNVTTNTARKPAFCQPKALISLTNVNDLAILLSHIKEATMLTLVLFLVLACTNVNTLPEEEAPPLLPGPEIIMISENTRNAVHNSSAEYAYDKTADICFLRILGQQWISSVPVDCETIGYTPAQQEAPL
jgi:hypothetical protein